jgi:hypothetical protein
MEMFMREIGLMIKQRGMVYISTWMVLNTRVNGSRTSSMGRERNTGLMELDMKGRMLMV